MPAIQIDSTGAVAFPLRYVSGLSVVAQRIWIRLTTATNEWITDAAFGLPYDDWTGSGTKVNVAPEELSALVRAQLEATPGVVRVVSIEATTNDGGRTVSLTASVEASEEGEVGLVNIETTPDPLATFGPPAWYVYAVSP